MASDASPAIAETSEGVTIHVYVAPRASTNKVVGLHNGALKVALTAPPVERAANKALVVFLANLLGVPKSSIQIVSGESSRSKVLRVQGITARAAEERLKVVP